MDLEMLTRFFMWCTILNGGLFVLWVVMVMAVPNLVYRTQKLWFPLPRETFDVIMYSFLGGFKLVFLVFNVVPLVALLIIG